MKNKKTEVLKSRKLSFKKLYSLLGSQPEARKLIKREDPIKVKRFNAKETQGITEAGLSQAYHSHVYGTYLTKLTSKARIAEYYQMSYDTELNYALTEIADEIVAENADGKLFGIEFRTDLDKEVKNLVMEEFKNLMINSLKLNDYNTIWDWVYKWLIQGVLSFKIEFDPEKNEGVTGLEEIQPWNLFQKEDTNNKESLISYAIREKDDDDEGIIHDKIEILQVDSGFFQDGEFFSILEFAKKDWRRLNLIEDATVMYKLSRSPLRRIFKVFVGKMAPKDAESFLNEFRLRMKEDISYDSSKGEVVGLNPITILDDYFFPVFEDGIDGVTIDTLEEKSTGWDSNDEIKHFLGKVYRAMKIPRGRMNIPDEGEDSTAWAGSRNGEITRDEIKFSKFIKRFRNRFLENFIQELFYRHLFFRNLISTFKLEKSDFKIKFLYDSPYEELKEQELIETRIGNFSDLLGSTESLSWRFLAKKYLKWTDEDFKENLLAWKEERASIGIIGMGDQENEGGDSYGGVGMPGGGGPGNSSDMDEPDFGGNDEDVENENMENENMDNVGDLGSDEPTLTEIPPKGSIK